MATMCTKKSLRSREIDESARLESASEAFCELDLRVAGEWMTRRNTTAERRTASLSQCTNELRNSGDP